MKFTLLFSIIFAGLAPCMAQAPLQPKAQIVLQDPQGIGMSQGVILNSSHKNVALLFCGEVTTQVVRPGNYVLSLAIGNKAKVLDECDDVVQHGTEIYLTPGERRIFTIVAE